MLGGGLALIGAPGVLITRRRRVAAGIAPGIAPGARASVRHLDRDTWRMPAVNRLAKPRQTLLRSVSVYGLRAYVLVSLLVVGVEIFGPFVH